MARLEEAIRVAGDADIGILQARRVDAILETSAARVCTAADYGKTIFLSYEGAVAITLPANGALLGSQIDFVVIGSDACVPTIAAATADTLIAHGDLLAKSVTFGTGQRIGAHCRVVSTGTVWVAEGAGGTTMTVNA